VVAIQTEVVGSCLSFKLNNQFLLVINIEKLFKLSDIPNMDPISTVLAGCAVYGGYRAYKFLSSPTYHCFPQDVSKLQGTPVYTFELIRGGDGTLNSEQITSNVILADKSELIDAIKFALTEYGSCTNMNSLVFYYGEIPLVKLVDRHEALTNVIVRLPRKQWSSDEFKIVTNKQYNFEGSIPETYDVALSLDGSLDISKHIIIQL
jgi:hypothetical protein